MSLRFKILTALAAIHLILVASSAAHLHLFTPRTQSGRAVTAYETFSGADATFSFFAPAVAPQFQARFTLIDDSGRTWEETGEQGATHEANLRFDGVTGMFIYERFRDQIGASWAAAFFGRYPHVRKVEIVAEAENIPTMKHWLEGYESRWDTVYEATFTRDGSGE
jgi:hypothetical protein